jgi:kanamycin nucleotidyltransferase
MAMAREITELLRARYGERLLGVLLEGSTAKGTDRPCSDLELSVVLTDGGDRWYPFFQRGMFIGVSYESLEAATSSAGSMGPVWPVAGDALQTGTPLYDPTGLYPRLLEKHQAAVRDANYASLIKDVMADMYENVLKVFSLHPEEGYQAGMFAGGAAFLAAMAVGLANRHRYLSVRTCLKRASPYPRCLKDTGRGLPGCSRQEVMWMPCTKCWEGYGRLSWIGRQALVQAWTTRQRRSDGSPQTRWRRPSR